MIDSGEDDHRTGNDDRRTGVGDRRIDNALEPEVGADTAVSLVQWAESCLENSPAPVTIIQRADYRLLYANPAFRQLHAIPKNPTGLPVAHIFAEPAASELERLVEKGVSSRTVAHEGTVTIHPGDPALHCSVWPLAYKDDSDLAIVMIELRPTTDADTIRTLQVDVTQRLLLSALRDQMAAEASDAAAKAAEAAAKVADLANAAKDRFLTTMSHELRTPLNAIGGYVELIEMGLRGPVTAEQHEDLSRIQRAQAHLLGLINAVLNYSKLESGSVEFEMVGVSLESTLDAVREMLLPHLHRQELVYRDLNDGLPPGDPVRVNADPEKLRQILINLLTNAIKFTAPGGMISSRIDVQDQLVLLHIGDSGRGIPDDQLTTVFDPFVQVGRSLNSDDQGVGLGLSISRDLARGMGGDLTVVSTLGAGSTFTLTLTRANTDARPSP